MEFSKFCHVFSVLILLGLALTGCASSSNKMVSNVSPEPQSPEPAKIQYASPAPAEGSLWTDTGALLFVDKRARRVGDTVTVDIVENTSSNMDVNTETKRKSGISAGIPHMFGIMEELGRKSSYFDPENMLEADLENRFKGEASSDRSGNITASIGARVIEVLPNGNLVIYGRREMRVNNEVQYIAISGVVRPVDIGPNNRVKSTYLADSSIEYTGQGVLADKQRPGWGTRVVDRLWPF